uniref:Uncharacterized protein n=1 Tax=Anguilla anguilla TaxID=7936 RepID=A0A0E9WFQ8_ANGAN
MARLNGDFWCFGSLSLFGKTQATWSSVGYTEVPVSFLVCL